MTAQPLQQNFTSAVRRMPPVCGGLRSDRLLNYVWVNKKKDARGKFDAGQSLCSVPLQYLDRAYENARKYPDTEVRIWIDDAMLGQTSRFFVQSHQYLYAPHNVRLMDLREIPRYADHKAFRPNTKTDIWERVDLARFMVLSHCLKTTEAKDVFYADFDVDDVMLDNRRTQLCLAIKGMAFAKFKKRWTLAHGYIAMRRTAQDYLDDTLLPAIEDSVAQGGEVFNTLVSRLFEERGWFMNHLAHPFIRAAIITDVPVFPIGNIIPQSDLYKNEGVCGYRFRG